MTNVLSALQLPVHSSRCQSLVAIARARAQLSAISWWYTHQHHRHRQDPIRHRHRHRRHRPRHRHRHRHNRRCMCRYLPRPRCRGRYTTTTVCGIRGPSDAHFGHHTVSPTMFTMLHCKHASVHLHALLAVQQCLSMSRSQQLAVQDLREDVLPLQHLRRVSGAARPERTRDQDAPADPTVAMVRPVNDIALAMQTCLADILRHVSPMSPSLTQSVYVCEYFIVYAMSSFFWSRILLSVCTLPVQWRWTFNGFR